MKKALDIGALLVLATLTQVATDIYLPSLPAIAEYFQVSLDLSQMTIAAYMVCLTFSQLIWGPLSDRFGRKKMTCLGLLMSTAGTLLCAVSPNIYALIFGRIIQGAGNGAAACLWRAFLRDRYSGKELASIASYFVNFMVLILVIAPILGGILQDSFGWQANFNFLLCWTLFSCFFALAFLGDNKIASRKKTEHLKAYLRLLNSPVFVGCCIANFFTYGGMFVWITLSPVILIENMGITSSNFGFLVGLTGLALILGSNLNGILAKRTSLHKLVAIGWSTIIVSGFLVLLGSWTLGESPGLVCAGAFVFYFGAAFTFANTNALAFEDFGDIAGSAAGLYAFIQTAGGATTSFILASITYSSSNFLAGLFIASGVFAWFSYQALAVKKPKPTTDCITAS